MKPQSCPTCGYAMKAITLTTNPDDHIEPKAGDLAVCLQCGEILVFDEQGLSPSRNQEGDGTKEKMHLRLPTVDDALNWDTQTFTEASLVQRLIRCTRPLS